MSRTTKSLYFTGDIYTEERQKIHANIKESIFVGEPQPENPESILMGGGSGTGKSKMANITMAAYKAESKDIVHIDSDQIKTMLPEYLELVDVYEKTIIPKVEDWSDILHDESSDIASEVLLDCIKERRNFIFDGTMKNLAKYKKIIELLKEADYSIEIIVTDVSIEEALNRIETRKEIDGRYVSKEVIEETHQKIVETFYILKDLVNKYTLYDTSGNEPSIIAQKIADIERVINSDLLRRFYNKADKFLNIEKLS